MGASRDYTSGNDLGVGLLEAPASSQPRAAVTRSAAWASVASASTAERTSTGFAPRVSGRTMPYAPGKQSPAQPAQLRPKVGAPSRRLGSKQIVSQRGRRVSTVQAPVSSFSKVIAYAFGLVMLGVLAAVWFSGLSTAQTFEIQRLSVTESTLDNQLETLNRDLENVRSSADVARRAAESSMGVPVQAGIVAVDDKGNHVEQRPAKPETEAIIDVNGTAVRPNQASSDPKKTVGMNDNLQAVPQSQRSAAEVPGNLPPTGNAPAQAPYAPRLAR